MAENDFRFEERLRRKMGRAARNQSIATRFTEEESRAISEAAARRGITVREWAREVMLQAASGAQTDLPVFTELIALRLQLNSVMRHLTTKEGLMSEETHTQMMAEIRRTKHEAARDVLAQYQERLSSS